MLTVLHHEMVIEHDRQDVDAAWLMLLPGCGSIRLEQHAQLVLFAGVDGLLGQAGVLGAPRLHLDNDERPVILGDDVDLPDMAAPVRGENREALILEVTEGRDFAGMTDALAQWFCRRQCLGRLPDAPPPSRWSSPRRSWPPRVRARPRPP